METKINAWSYSRLSTWQQCPFKAKLLMIDKLKEPSSPAMERGSEIHKKLEEYIKTGRSNRKAPAVAGVYRDYISGIRKNKQKYKNVEAELQVAFNRDLKQVDWFAWDAWLRAVIDLYIIEDDEHSIIIDYKTGKRNDSHVEQANMYAAIYYLMNKDTMAPSHELQVKFLYVDSPDICNMLERVYNKATCEKWLTYFLKLGETMTNDTTFDATPNNFCRWCYFRKANNGPCKY